MCVDCSGAQISTFELVMSYSASLYVEPNALAYHTNITLSWSKRRERNRLGLYHQAGSQVSVLKFVKQCLLIGF